MTQISEQIDADTKMAITAMACAALLFCLALLSIHANAVLQVEQEILSAMAESRHPWLDVFFNWATLLGDFNVMCPVVVLAAIALLYQHEVKIAGVLCISFFGAALTTTLLKMTFDRPRPELFDSALAYLPLNAAFPSGHTTHATALALFLTWLAFRQQRYALLLVASLIATLVATSRLYLQVHWPTDLLGALAVSLFWVSLAVLSVDFLQRNQEQRG